MFRQVITHRYALPVGPIVGIVLARRLRSASRAFPSRGRVYSGCHTSAFAARSDVWALIESIGVLVSTHRVLKRIVRRHILPITPARLRD